jgi:hypothetical protein
MQEVPVVVVQAVPEDMVDYLQIQVFQAVVVPPLDYFHQSRVQMLHMLAAVVEDCQTTVLVLMVRQFLLALVVVVTVQLLHGLDLDRFLKVETLQVVAVVVAPAEVLPVVPVAQVSSFSNGHNKWQSVEDSTAA